MSLSTETVQEPTRLYQPVCVEGPGGPYIPCVDTRSCIATFSHCSHPMSSQTHRVSAPISGAIRSIKVKVGDSVKRGDVLCTQSMAKTEANVTAPADGRVKSFAVTEGQTVSEGGLVAEISG